MAPYVHMARFPDALKAHIDFSLGQFSSTRLRQGGWAACEAEPRLSRPSPCMACTDLAQVGAGIERGNSVLASNTDQPHATGWGSCSVAASLLQGSILDQVISGGHVLTTERTIAPILTYSPLCTVMFLTPFKWILDLDVDVVHMKSFM